MLKVVVVPCVAVVVGIAVMATAVAVVASVRVQSEGGGVRV